MKHIQEPKKKYPLYNYTNKANSTKILIKKI